MSTPRKIRAIPRLIQHLFKMPFAAMKGLMRWVMRVLLLIGRQPQSQAGFVLPTTALLLLVVTLTVGAIGYRTYTRTQATIGERQQRVIYNAATPAIDRARAKLEFMFDPLRDPRAGGVPSQRQLLGMMLNDGRAIAGSPGPQRFPTTGPDPYTLPGEARLDLDGDGKWDNAWKYAADTNGDGTNDATVLYSIIMTAPPNNATGVTPANPLQDSRRAALTTRAGALQVRNAPLSNSNQSNLACLRSNGGGTGLGLINGDGWFPDPNNRTKLRKNFQVNAYVVPNSLNGTVTTLEFQQDREATQGFKWAAWFRNDIEIFPGADFNWNGAMHTEGSYILGGQRSATDALFRSYLISSEESCVFDKSELTVARKTNSTGVETFAGQFVVGVTRDNSTTGAIDIDLSADPAATPSLLNAGNDSVAPTGGVTTTDFTLEPVILQTQDISRARRASIANPQTAADPNWVNGVFNDNAQGRMIQATQATPYLDDLFRADNRSGPKPVVGRRNPRAVEVITPGGIGQNIPSSEQELIRDVPPSGAANSEVGLDGYWERRARLEGLRLVVGQRLELGDPAGWGGPTNDIGQTLDGNPVGAGTEPLRPWDGSCTGGATGRCNEQRQRRALLDNLPAVQSTAVYHANAVTGGDFPLACLATTVHPGTAGTLDKSATFEDLAAPLWGTAAIPGYTDAANPMVISDFFRGRGTNGWEFATHNIQEFTNPNSKLMFALRNLANYAGDPLGGAPSFQPPIERAGRGEVHPYPSMAMWGDFSVLRRVLAEHARVGYPALSPADKTTLHTAACTLGMLAYNIDYLEKLDYTVLNNPPVGAPAGTPPVLGFTTLPATLPPGLTLPAPPAVLTYDQFRRHLNGLTSAQIQTYFTSTLSLAELQTYFSGLRGRIRLLDLMMMTPVDAATGRAINTRLRTGNAALAALAIPDPNPTGGASRILNDLAALTDNERQFALADDRNNNPEFYVRWLERWRDDPGVGNAGTASRTTLQNDIYLAQLIITKEQVARDRQIGFLGFYGSNTGNEGGETSERSWGRSPLGRCRVWSGSRENAADPTPPVDPLSMLCSRRPRYPILYSLFPAKLNEDASGTPLPPLTVDAAYDGAGTDDFQAHADYRGTGSESDLRNDNAVRDSEDRGTRSTYFTLQNATVTYQVVRPQDVAVRPRRLPMPGSLTALGGAIRDRATGNIAVQDWFLPVGTATSSGFTPNNNALNQIKVCSVSCSYPAGTSNQANYPRPVALTNSIGAMVPIPFKDHAIFNGREMVTVRTLDLDLDLLRSSTTNLTNDYWLPRSAIVYGFREDAVSEANIVRPASGLWASCNTEALMQATANCQMDTYQNAYVSADPPLNSTNRITPKPVDYLPDPDRRPHGFRLKQGISLVRGGSATNENNIWRGISFISPNPAYILGNFNLHRSFGTTPTPIEEFTVSLAANYSNFYQRGSGGANGVLDSNFAKGTTDQFRPSEVVADGVTVLSSNFCDGSIQDGIATASQAGPTISAALQARYGCNTNRTSFLNQNRPLVRPSATINTGKQVFWVTTNIADSYPLILRNLATGTNPDIGESPLLVSRNGMPVQWSSDTSFRSYRPADGFYRASLSRPLNTATNTQVNTILVSGITPTRTNQAYGGLHNFPRFLENWGSNTLFFSGAFLQLNFSSYATGPFDQDAWEQGATPAAGSGCANSATTSREDICYYSPPTRRWGYDPALQYGPPAPVAERFQQPEATRSEFYSEPPADDPYIQRLSRCVGPNSCRPS